MTDAQLAAKLGVSRRTTQDYRDKGYFPYYRIDGKILYAEDDKQSFLSRTDCIKTGAKITPR